MAPLRLHWALPALLVALLGLLWHRRQRRGRPGPPDSRPPLQAKPQPSEGPPVTCGPATPAAAAVAATPLPDAALKSGAEEASALTGGRAPQTVREELANTLRSEYFNKFACEEQEESKLIGGGIRVSQTVCEELGNSLRSEDFNKLVCENWEDGEFAEGGSQLSQTVREKLRASQQSEDFNKFVQEQSPVKEFRIQREPVSEGANFEKSVQRQANFQEEVVKNCIVDIGNSQNSEITSHTESGNKDIKVKVYILSEGLKSLSQSVESHTKHIGKRKENHSPKKGEEGEETCDTTRVRHSEGSGVCRVEQEEVVSSSKQVQVEAVCRPQEAKEVEACRLTQVEAVSNPEQATQLEVSSLNKSELAVEIYQSKRSSSEAESRGEERLEGEASSSKSEGQEVVSSSENREEIVRSQKNPGEVVTNLKRTEEIVRSNEDSHEASRSTESSEVVRSTKKVKEVEEGCQINQVQLVTSSKKKKPSNKVKNLVHTGQREAASSPKEAKQTEEIQKSTVAEQNDFCSLNLRKGRRSENTKQEEVTNSSMQEGQVEFFSSSQTEVKSLKESEETNTDKVFKEDCSMQEKKIHTKETNPENSNHQQADKVQVNSHMQAEHEGTRNQESEQAEEAERILELVEDTESNQSQTQANQEEDSGCQQVQLAEEVGSLEGTQLAEEAENSPEGEAEEIQSQQPREETKVVSSDRVEEVEVEVLSYQQTEGKIVGSHHQAKTAAVVSNRQSEEVEINSQQTDEKIAIIHQTKEPEIVSSQLTETAIVSSCRQSEEVEISNQTEEVFSSHQTKEPKEDPSHSQSEETNIVSNLHHESEETEVISSQPPNKTEVSSSHLSEGEGSGDQEVKGISSATQTELASGGTSTNHQGGMAEGASGEPGSPSRAAVASAGPGVVRAMSGERDSANHSPAEGMLGSSRLCRCSDVQSEDSSDSGKGCSDAPTPASRTPASGSSEVGEAPGELAAELATGAPLVYEFVLPQHLVGRLIGRHGCFVHQIKAQTNASILIKRHPETVRLKVCAVEGSQADVESALEMIRHKFPQKRYPNVTLEQVCFVPPVATVPMQPDCLRLQLVEGISNDVILSSLVTPSHFFLQQPTHPTYPALARLCACMNATYSESAAPLLPAMHAGMVAAAPVMGGWYRAEVVSVEEQEGSCQVRYVDFGGYEVQPCSALRQIRADFMTLPFQAAECYLANVVGPGEGEQWSPEALAAVEELTAGQVLQAQVCGYSEDGVPAVCLYALHGTCVIPVNRELVVRNLARWWEPQQQAE